MLYIYSWRSSWAGKVVLDETIRKEERLSREKIRILEEMGAPDHDIVEARIGLAKVLMQSGPSHYNDARYCLDDADAHLTNNKSGADLQDVLADRVTLNKLYASICRDSNLYEFASERYEKTAKLLAQAKPNRQVQYMKVMLLNEQAVLQYIWANSSKEESDRKKHFALAEALYQKCLHESRQHFNEPEGAKYRYLAQLCQENLTELTADVL